PDGVEGIGVSAPSGGVGPAEWLRIDGLEPGWYRLRKETHEGVVATGHFAVVDEPVALVDIGDPAQERLSLHPVVLGSGKADITVAPVDESGYHFQQWIDGRWTDSSMVAPASQSITV